MVVGSSVHGVQPASAVDHRVSALSAGDPSDAALVERTLAGDPTAFAGLYARHHVTLYRTALAMTRGRSRAEELVQEAFLRAYRHLGQVVLGPGASLRPWLLRILVNLVYDDSARRTHPMQSLDGMDERLATPSQPSTEGHVEVRELRRAVNEAIRQLPVKHQAVVVLFYLHDLDVGEIAAELGVPAGTVKSRLFYGRARLREILAAQDPDTAERGAAGPQASEHMAAVEAAGLAVV